MPISDYPERGSVIFSPVEERLHRDLREVVFRNANVGLLGGYAALFGLYLNNWDPGARYLTDWWCLTLLFCLLGRTGSLVLQWQQRAVNPEAWSVIPYKLYYGFSVVEGWVWGAAMFAIFPGEVLNQALLLIVLIAIAVGAMATFSGSMSLYAIYATSIIFMAFLKLLSLPAMEYHILGWLSWALLLVLLVVARRMNSSFIDMMRLSLKNEQLAMIEAASKESIVDFSKKLSAKTQEVETVTAQLKKLVTVLSHDLRTHLITVNQFARFLSKKTASPDEHKFIVETLQKSAESGLQLVQDILGVTGVEPSTMVLDLSSESVPNLVERAVDRIKPMAEDKGVKVFLAVDEERPVRVDLQRIEDVLAGLIEAAVVHSPPEGSVTVQSTPTVKGLRVEVIDSGDRLTPAQIAKLFEQPQGRLLGHEDIGSLALLQEILRAHDSRIEVSANPTEGSCFSFVLPWAAQSR